MKSENGDDTMNTASERYCSIQESIVESCKQVKLMRQGSVQKRTWSDVLKERQKSNDKGE